MSEQKSKKFKRSFEKEGKNEQKFKRPFEKDGENKASTKKQPKAKKANSSAISNVSMRNYYLFWLLCAIAGISLIYVLRGVLLPFVLGMVIAYLLDPVADKLTAKGISRTFATVIVMCCCFLAVLVGVIALLPALKSQIVELSSNLPVYAQDLWGKLEPAIKKTSEKISPEYMERISAYLQEFSSTAAGWGVLLLKGLLNNSMAIISLFSMVFVTPIVVFYFLRDWDDMVDVIDSYLPRRHVKTIREQFTNIDNILSSFLRGQALVCVLLGTFYAIGLSVIGLDGGLVIGVIAGIISFIPYVGSIVGVVLAVLLAAAQFGDVTSVLMVLGVFGVGQFVEGNILTPKLVGESVGLHALWVMFALLAGGALFGFLGLLIAVPAAAVIGVLVRYSLTLYKDSSFYVDHG
jgi:predicted PurR-regulated permease PerM